MPTIPKSEKVHDEASKRVKIDTYGLVMSSSKIVHEESSNSQGN